MTEETAAIFVDHGIHITAPTKTGEPASMSEDEHAFCQLMAEVFAGDSLDQYLQRPRQLAIGWANEYLSPAGRRRLKQRLDEECAP